MLAFMRKLQVAVYCSDVSGAFDRVSRCILVQKLRRRGLPEDIVKLMDSWLRTRQAHIVVDGTKSQAMNLSDMVYQGTVMGPVLWNVFFEDSRHAINKLDFHEIVYADDLNADKEFQGHISTQ
eukprot:3209772-Karenia_brevis.AAC.1